MFIPYFSVSFDSLYDSLASEMENSSSETFSPSARSTVISTGRDSYANDSGIDAGGPMSLAAEMEASEKVIRGF